MLKNVVFGFLGSKLDAGSEEFRWDRWRPTVALGMHEDFLIHRYELFYQPGEEALCAAVTADLRAVSPETEIRPHLMPLDDPWDFEEVYGRLHDFAGAYAFHLEAERYLVNITTGTHAAQICLFLLTESRHFPGKLLQASPPPRKFRGTVAGRYTIIDLDLSKYDQLATRFALERQTTTSFLKSGIETQNAAFNRLIEQIERVVVAGPAPILLTGATGVGKSQLARRIYELKRQRNMLAGAFVEVNCATLRGDQSMSALFGHKKGSFTGATENRPGLLRTADAGMLFLDEIGELGPDEQAMLLRAIEEKRFLPVGSDTDAASDFQLIAGTNRDLQAAVRAGRFREDLLARINLWTFRLPGLAQRREDIAPNVDYELGLFTARTGQKVSFNAEARAAFLDFAASPASVWRANFRDLNAAITRMATLSHGGRITPEIVRDEVSRLCRAWDAGGKSADAEILERFLTAEQLSGLDRFDRPQLAEVLRVCRESATLSEAGRALFAVSRTQKKTGNDADRLSKYLARFGVSWENVKWKMENEK